MTTTITETTAPDASQPDLAGLRELGNQLPGRVLLPGTEEYAALSTPWNVAVRSTPVAVVQAARASDVGTAVQYAAAHDLDVSVQCTGHGAYDCPRPTLLVHTGQLDELTIDPVARTARVGAGVCWEQVLNAAAPHGLGALAGSAPGVGVVGYLTGGGLSPVARTFGYASDLVTAFDVVTRDGELRRATPTQNPALFWALRGGKGALGIVTAVEFELLPVAEIYGGCLFFDGSDAATVLSAWRDWCATLPDEASTSVAVMRLPALPTVPPPLAGRCTIAVRFAWVGDPAAGAATIEAMSQVAPVIVGGTGVMPFAALGSIHADPVDPMPVHESSLLLRDLSGDAVDTFAALTGPDSTCPQIIVELRLLGGAIARAPRHPSAVGHRDAAFTLAAIGVAAPPVGDATVAHAEELMSAMAPWSDGVTQPNFAASADPAAVARKYDAPTLARLASLADTYDPRRVIAAARGVRAAQATAGALTV